MATKVNKLDDVDRRTGKDCAASSILHSTELGRVRIVFSHGLLLSCSLSARSSNLYVFCLLFHTGKQGVGTEPLSYFDSNRIISLAKHYAAYGDAAGGLNAGPAHADMQTIFDIYLKVNGQGCVYMNFFAGCIVVQGGPGC